MEFLGALDRRADWQAGRCLPFARLERRKSLTIVLGSVAASHTSRGISQIQSPARPAPCDRDDVVRRSGPALMPDLWTRTTRSANTSSPIGGAGEVRRCASAYSATMNGAVARPYALPFGILYRASAILGTAANCGRSASVDL